MPRINRKRKNVPQRKPKTIKFNPNDIEHEHEQQQTEPETVAATTTGMGEMIDVVIAENAVNQTLAMNDLVDTTNADDDLAHAEMDDITTDDVKGPSKNTNS